MDKVKLGKIVKPQGIKGEVKVLPHTNVPSAFDGLKEIYIDGKAWKISTSVFRFGFGYIKLENVNDRNASESLRNKIIYCDKSAFDKLGDDTYLIEDLIGCKIIAKGKEIGEIIEIDNYGAGDIFDVRCNGRPAQVPFLKNIFVKIDVKAGFVEVDLEKFNGAKVEG